MYRQVNNRPYGVNDAMSTQRTGMATSNSHADSPDVSSPHPHNQYEPSSHFNEQEKSQLPSGKEEPLNFNQVSSKCKSRRVPICIKDVAEANYMYNINDVKCFEDMAVDFKMLGITSLNVREIINIVYQPNPTIILLLQRWTKGLMSNFVVDAYISIMVNIGNEKHGSPKFGLYPMIFNSCFSMNRAKTFKSHDFETAKKHLFNGETVKEISLVPALIKEQFHFKLFVKFCHFKGGSEKVRFIISNR